MPATDDDQQAANEVAQPHVTAGQRRALAELVALSEEMGLYDAAEGHDDDRPARGGDEHRTQE